MTGGNGMLGAGGEQAIVAGGSMGLGATAMGIAATGNIKLQSSTMNLNSTGNMTAAAGGNFAATATRIDLN